MKQLIYAVLLGMLLAQVQGCALLDPVAQSTPLMSPYKHLNMWVDAENPQARTQVHGRVAPLVDRVGAASSAPLSAITLAFASGECGSERWGGLDANAVALANVATLATHGLPYMISTGGEGNVFTCGSDAGMEQFVARYTSSALLGLDFDIESTQTPANIRDLVQRVKQARSKWPHLRFSFTLATLAASDGSGAGLNAIGNTVLQALKEAGVSGYYINLMVMDFGPAEARNCVVVQGRCDMAVSARQAVQNLHAAYGVPFSHIEVTAMIGVNDVIDNVFTLDDATRLARFVRDAGLGGLHFWSLDRDGPCAHGATDVSPACSSLNAHPAGAFSKAFADGLR